MKKHTEMEIQILAVLSHIWAAVVGLLSTGWGKMIALALLITSFKPSTSAGTSARCNLISAALPLLLTAST